MTKQVLCVCELVVFCFMEKMYVNLFVNIVCSIWCAMHYCGFSYRETGLNVDLHVPPHRIASHVLSSQMLDCSVTVSHNV